MENNEIMNVAEVAETTKVLSTKKIGAGEVAILGFAGVGVIASGYALFKGAKWLIGKIKDKQTDKAAEKLVEAAEEAKAEESTAE